MKESKQRLRLRFQAETDVEVDPCPQDWKRYAEWLEKLAIKKLNNELLKENNLLLKKIQEAMDALEEGVRKA